MVIDTGNKTLSSVVLHSKFSRTNDFISSSSYMLMSVKLIRLKEFLKALGQKISSPHVCPMTKLM